VSANIYFGTSSNSLSFLMNQPDPTNVVVLADHGHLLSPGSTYYWRVDTVLADSSVVTGEVWSFTTGGTPPFALPSFDGFEEGFGNWTSAGPETYVVTDVNFAHEGTNSVHIKNDNVGSVLTLAEPFDASPYSSVAIDFWFKMASMDGPDEAFIEFYDGVQWQVIGMFGQPHGYGNGAFDHETISVVSNAYTMPTNALFRFRQGGGGDADHIYYDEITISGNTYDSYANWLADYKLAGSNALTSADLEPDGLDNFAEYALGGNPTNDDASAVLPTSGIIPDLGTNWLEYVYRRRSDHAERGLAYTVEVTTNLVSGTWSTNGVMPAGSGVIDVELDSVTNRIGTSIENVQFIRLKVEEL
jgi:hypothetical protein